MTTSCVYWTFTLITNALNIEKETAKCAIKYVHEYITCILPRYTFELRMVSMFRLLSGTCKAFPKNC